MTAPETHDPFTQVLGSQRGREANAWLYSFGAAPESPQQVRELLDGPLDDAVAALLLTGGREQPMVLDLASGIASELGRRATFARVSWARRLASRSGIRTTQAENLVLLSAPGHGTVLHIHPNGHLPLPQKAAANWTVCDIPLETEQVSTPCRGLWQQPNADLRYRMFNLCSECGEAADEYADCREVASYPPLPGQEMAAMQADFTVRFTAELLREIRHARETLPDLQKLANGTWKSVFVDALAAFAVQHDCAFVERTLENGFQTDYAQHLASETGYTGPLATLLDERDINPLLRGLARRVPNKGAPLPRGGEADDDYELDEKYLDRLDHLVHLDAKAAQRR